MNITSVVMTRALALGLIVTSPVIRPTSWNSSYNSRYFWLLKAFRRNARVTGFYDTIQIWKFSIRILTYNKYIDVVLKISIILIVCQNVYNKQTQQTGRQSMYEPIREQKTHTMYMYSNHISTYCIYLIKCPGIY